MQHSPARRLLAGLAAACAALAVGGAPALAAPKAADVTMYLFDITTPAGADGAVLEPIFFATEETWLQQPHITYELSGDLAGVTLAGADGVDDCENETPTKLVCSNSFEMVVYPDGMAGGFDAHVVADDTAVPGATGTVSATFSARNLAPVTKSARVRVAEAVDLTAGPPTEVSAAPGASFEAPVAVRNSGERAIEGASVVFFNDWAFEPTTRYRNCRYSGDELTSCTFDQTLEPGGSYQATMPYRVRRDTQAPGGASGEMLWLTQAELEDFEKYMDRFGVDLGTPGTGDVLTLGAASGARRAPQSDTHADDNNSRVHLTVTGRNGVDLAAVGADLTGAAGDKITVPLGVRNVGPATLDRSGVDDPAAVTAVYKPQGTTVVSASDRCYPVVNGRIDFDKAGRGGYAKYECHSHVVLLAGTEEMYEFVLRVDRVVPGATGKVAVNEPCECARFTKDVNKANDTAAITLNRAGAGAGDGGGAGGGGTLPITGPAGLTIAGVGLALLATGTLALLVVRRRRTTFSS